MRMLCFGLFLFMCLLWINFLNFICYVTVPKQNGFVEDDLNCIFLFVLILFSDSKSPGDAKYLEAFGKC